MQLVLLFGWGCKQSLFLECTDSLGTDLQFNLLAINDNSLLLQVWFPYLLGVALRETYVVSELLALAGDFALAHYFYPSVLGVYFSCFHL
jgi:hypothetical protein